MRMNYFGAKKSSVKGKCENFPHCKYLHTERRQAELEWDGGRFHSTRLVARRSLTWRRWEKYGSESSCHRLTWTIVKSRNLTRHSRLEFDLKECRMSSGAIENVTNFFSKQIFCLRISQIFWFVTSLILRITRHRDTISLPKEFEDTKNCRAKMTRVSFERKTLQGWFETSFSRSFLFKKSQTFYRDRIYIFLDYFQKHFCLIFLFWGSELSIWTSSSLLISSF